MDATDHLTVIQGCGPRRKSSYLSSGGIDLYRRSVDSLYNSVVSISLSINSTSSCNSNHIEKIGKKNIEILDFVSDQLSTFFYYTGRNQLGCNLNSSEVSSASSSVSELVVRPNEKVIVRDLLTKIANLSKYLEEFQKKNSDGKEEIRQADEENRKLQQLIVNIGGQLAGTVIETHSISTGCKCEIV